jgi:pimeloyl-ACP methyl ester carboxylesterase
MPRRPLLVLGAALVAGAVALYTPDRDRQTLERRYLAAPGDLRVVDGTPLHVRDTGPRDAPALLLLHGLASSLHTWEPWARALADSFRVVRIDLPGHGLSGPDARGDYRDARTHALLAALLDTLGIGRATVIGNSIGGRIAWSFAARHPARVAGLVLVSPDGFASPGFEYGKAPDVPAALGVMRWVLPTWLLRLNLEPAYGDPARITDSTMTRYHDLMRAPGVRQALLDRMRQTVLTDPVPRLRAIAVPTLLVWGAKDGMIPPANATDYLRVMRDARAVTLPGLGHVPFEEDPVASLAAVRPFLDALRPGGTRR